MHCLGNGVSVWQGERARLGEGAERKDGGTEGVREKGRGVEGVRYSIN